MNYYAARQREKDKRWDYTVRNNDHTSPVGYCCSYVPLDEWMKLVGIEHPQTKIYKSNSHKHHTDGHATQEEAQECYRQYLLDQHLRLKKENRDEQHKCKVCGAWTQLYAEIDMKRWELCEQHNNRKEVENLFEAPGEIWSS